jgi:hypothetical protein
LNFWTIFIQPINTSPTVKTYTGKQNFTL